METDLAVTAVVGACVLAAIAAGVAWAGRSISAGRLPLRGRLALRPRGVPRTPEALLAVNRPAAPFMRHYALIVGVLALLVMVMAPFSDVAAAVIHLIAVVMLCLGAWVCWTRARRAAAALPRQVAAQPKATPEAAGALDVNPLDPRDPDDVASDAPAPDIRDERADDTQVP